MLSIPQDVGSRLCRWQDTRKPCLGPPTIWLARPDNHCLALHTDIPTYPFKHVQNSTSNLQNTHAEVKLTCRRNIPMPVRLQATPLTRMHSVSTCNYVLLQKKPAHALWSVQCQSPTPLLSLEGKKKCESKHAPDTAESLHDPVCLNPTKSP